MKPIITTTREALATPAKSENWILGHAGTRNPNSFINFFYKLILPALFAPNNKTPLSSKSRNFAKRIPIITMTRVSGT